MEFAPAFGPSHASRQRQQAGRTPNASHGGSFTERIAPISIALDRRGKRGSAPTLRRRRRRTVKPVESGSMPTEGAHELIAGLRARAELVRTRPTPSLEYLTVTSGTRWNASMPFEISPGPESRGNTSARRHRAGAVRPFLPFRFGVTFHPLPFTIHSRVRDDRRTITSFCWAGNLPLNQRKV
jgi:hypothetical protein